MQVDPLRRYANGRARILQPFSPPCLIDGNPFAMSTQLTVTRHLHRDCPSPVLPPLLLSAAGKKNGSTTSPNNRLPRQSRHGTSLTRKRPPKPRSRRPSSLRSSRSLPRSCSGNGKRPPRKKRPPPSPFSRKPRKNQLSNHHRLHRRDAGSRAQSLSLSLRLRKPRTRTIAWPIGTTSQRTQHCVQLGARFQHPTNSRHGPASSP